MSQQTWTPDDDMDDVADFAVSEAGLRLDTHRVIPACTGPCNQGGKTCPHPQACQLSEDEDQSLSADARVWPQLIAVAILSVLLCWHVAAWLLEGGAA